MAFPATKKRRLSPISGPDHIVTYPHHTAPPSFLDSGNGKSQHVRGMRRKLPATNEAKTNDQTSWDSAVGDSNMFKLKMHQLLARVQPDYERRMVKAEDALRKLQDTIEQIPDRRAKPVCISAFVSTEPLEFLTFLQVLEAEREQLETHNVRIPFPQPRPAKDAKYTLAYFKPANIRVVGSYARRTAIQVAERLAIDLAVTMPSVRPLLRPFFPIIWF